MDEPEHQLEQRLAGLRPRTLAPQMAERIAARLHGNRQIRPSDRFLWAAIASGAAAACLIVSMLATEPPPAPVSALAALHDPRPHAPDDSITVLARAGPRWGDELNWNSNWSTR